MTQTSIVPRQFFAVSLASDDVAGQRRFYEAWGWQALPYSNQEYVAFQLEGAIVAFVRKALLAEEAAPGAGTPAASGWNGVTLAVKRPRPRPGGPRLAGGGRRRGYGHRRARRPAVGRPLRLRRRPGRQPLGDRLGAADVGSGRWEV